MTPEFINQKSEIQNLFNHALLRFYKVFKVNLYKTNLCLIFTHLHAFYNKHKYAKIIFKVFFCKALFNTF